MSCERWNNNHRWLNGILGAVGINLLLLLFISLLFQSRTLPRRLTSCQPVPVWRVEQVQPESESRPEQETKPPAAIPDPPPLSLDSLPRPQTEKLPAVALPPPDLTLSPRITGLPVFSPMIRTEKEFYQPGELDRQPAPMGTPAPLYPPRARMRGIEGEVRVRFLVDPEGLVKDIRIVRAKPAGYFESAVKNALATWRFRPGRLGRSKVATEVETTIVFKLDR
jgi:protein TonB